MRRLSLILAVLLLPGTTVRAHDGHEHVEPGIAMIAEAAEHLVPPDIPVIDRFGRTAGFLERLGGRGPVIIAFIYTNCDGICDISNAILQAAGEIARGDDGAVPTLVSVTIDPARDTPAVLDGAARLYAAGQDWLWLTAGAAGTAPLLRSLGVPVTDPEAHEPVFLIGDFCSFRFLRVTGLSDPELLVAEARRRDGCG
jgi:protein SCO1/2